MLRGERNGEGGSSVGEKTSGGLAREAAPPRIPLSRARRSGDFRRGIRSAVAKAERVGREPSGIGYFGFADFARRRAAARGVRDLSPYAADDEPGQRIFI